MYPIILVTLLSYGLFLSPAIADSISCDGGIVSDGNSVVDLLMKCGQPAWKESHQEEFTDRLGPGLKQRTYVTVEQWTYNFGPQQLLRTVTIKNGVVIISRRSYLNADSLLRLSITVFSFSRGECILGSFDLRTLYPPLLRPKTCLLYGHLYHSFPFKAWLDTRPGSG